MRKSLFMAAALLLASGIASAQATKPADIGHSGLGLSWSAGMHGATDYNFRGTSLSPNSSVGVQLHAAHHTGFFAAGTLDSIQVTGDRQGLLTGTVGYTKDIGNGVTVGAGLKHNQFMGGAGLKHLSFSEAFISSSWNGVTATLSRNIQGADRAVAGLGKGDYFGELGYTHKLGQWDVGGSVGYAWYGDRSPGASNNSTHTQVRAGYRVNPNLHVGVTYQIDGNDGFDSQNANRNAWLKASYTF